MSDTFSNGPEWDRIGRRKPIFLGTLDDAKHTDSFLSRKRLLPYILTSILLITLAIPLVIRAVAIRLDSPGPVFFVNHAWGFATSRFMIWKFSTMKCETVDIEGSQLTLRNDLRVTRFGTPLRNWSVDEVLQLFNLPVGDMSLVGPRPRRNLGGSR
jgi:lipopolysaccharide/colanic/teichoic acid biosynthesis glycosyltransferase